jgi:2-dehydro-3-deoxygluconokinase
MDVQAVTVGEVLIELERGPDDRYSIGFGGDTFHTAIWLARAGIETSFCTALGQDRYSDAALEAAAAAGVTADLVLRMADRLPGLCLIANDADGERRREYWRDTSPARQLFELPRWDRIAEQLVTAELVYLTGTTLSLYSNVGLGRLLAALEFARERGAIVAFDGAWESHNWRGDEQRARAVLAEALKRCSVALPSFASEAKLWGDPAPAATVERLATFGVTEIAVKNGAEPMLVHAEGKSVEVPLPEMAEVPDTNPARDAFNAGYLAARLKKELPEAAALAGHTLAAECLRNAGPAVPAPRRNGGSS